jgi:hypothetical protein
VAPAGSGAILDGISEVHFTLEPAMANRVETHSPRSDIKDRLATAFGSAIMMAITFVLLAIATAFFTILISFFSLPRQPRVNVFDGTARLVIFFDNFIITALCVFMALAALMGFTFGSKRMARLFGILWQTEVPTRGEFWIAIFIVLALLGTMLVYGLRKIGIT